MVWDINVPKFTKPLHFDQTTAPSMNAEKNLVSFNMLGLFEDVTGESKHTLPTTYPPHFEDSHQFQFWIHQSMINSAAFASELSVMPMTIADEQVATMLGANFPEIKAKFGDDAVLTVVIDKAALGADFIGFNTHDGITIGQDDSMAIYFNVIATVDKKSEVAFSLKMLSETKVDLSAQNFIADLQISSLKVKNIEVHEDNVNLGTHDFASVMPWITAAVEENLNLKFKDPIDIFAKINPMVGQIVDLFLPNATITPFQEEGFLYFGINSLAPGEVPADFDINVLF